MKLVVVVVIRRLWQEVQAVNIRLKEGKVLKDKLLSQKASFFSLIHDKT
jgi:hypothetical protein